jgi:hypothetical protein
MHPKELTTMKTFPKFLQAGLAACLLAGASLPALSSAPWPDVDFEWYSNVGKGRPMATITALPAPRAGYIWSPAHYEWNGSRMEYMPGIWIQDDYENQWRMYAFDPNVVYATVRPELVEGIPALRDRDGNVIPTSPDAYPVESARR